jgi:TrpR-related protein YerC/YecD
MKSTHSEAIEKLYRAITLLGSTEECREFFEDICTVKELLDISQRLEVAQLLKTGKSYQVISKETGASTATISRVNRSLVYGNGGYESVLVKLGETEK